MAEKTYDIEKLKADIKQAATACVEAKRVRRETESAYGHWLAKHPGSREPVMTVNAVRNAASTAADYSTMLCATRAHIRGRLHSLRQRLSDGSIRERTLEMQAREVGAWLKEYELTEAQIQQP